jgi:hypothetical protein
MPRHVWTFVTTEFSLLFCSDPILCAAFSFMVLYNRDNVESIGLDEAAKCLGVERRRIYDIVNVLEGVGVSSSFSCIFGRNSCFLGVST